MINYVVLIWLILAALILVVLFMFYYNKKCVSQLPYEYMANLGENINIGANNISQNCYPPNRSKNHRNNWFSINDNQVHDQNTCHSNPNSWSFTSINIDFCPSSHSPVPCNNINPYTVNNTPLSDDYQEPFIFTRVPTQIPNSEPSLPNIHKSDFDVISTPQQISHCPNTGTIGVPIPITELVPTTK